VSEKEGDVAAVLSETVRSAPFIPPPDYWRRVRMACDKHGALLILDGLPTGLGRTGKRFACEHYGIVPDMLVLGKALGGGVMPLAALIARDSLNVAADRALGHYTHQKNPIAAAAALARLRDMQSRHPIIGDVRGLGLMLGVELVRDRATMTRACEAAERVSGVKSGRRNGRFPSTGSAFGPRSVCVTNFHRPFSGSTR